MLAHGAAFLVLGFTAGLCARAAFDAHVAMPRSHPEDLFLVTPATADAPAMAVWVAADLVEMNAAPPALQTLKFMLPEDHPAHPAAAPAVSAQSGRAPRLAAR